MGKCNNYIYHHQADKFLASAYIEEELIFYLRVTKSLYSIKGKYAKEHQNIK